MEISVALSHLFVAIKDSVLKKLLTEILMEFWGEWELRLMVIVSLILQVVLVISGNLRQTYIGKKLPYVAIIAWLVYMSADMMATLVLSTLLNGDVKLNNGLIVFWTPFLLWHLGSPHNITAYSLEDNDMWLRHFLGMVFLISEAIYIYYRFQSDAVLNSMAFPIFIVGIFKYGEKIWALRAASEKQLINSLYPSNRKPVRQTNMVVIRKGLSESAINFEGKNNSVYGLELLREAYSSFVIFKPLYIGLPFGLSQKYFRNMVDIESKSAEEAFKLVGAELAYLYDLLFTKMPIHHSKTKASLSLRVLCFLSAVSSLIAFSAIVDKSAHAKVDIVVTYLLLLGAICLDIYSFIMHALSIWAVIWLPNVPGNKLLEVYSKAVASRLHLLEPKLTIKSMAQHDLIKYYVKAMGKKYTESVRPIDTGNLLQKYGHTSWKPVDSELKKFIFDYLVNKRKHNYMISGDYKYFKLEELEKVLNGRCDNVSEFYPELEGMLDDWHWDSAEVTRRIFFWHFATDLVYYDDIDRFRGGILGSCCQIAKSLSDYMMYLVLVRPLMLPKGLGEVINTEYHKQANVFFPEDLRKGDFTDARKKFTSAVLQHTDYMMEGKIDDNINGGKEVARTLQSLVIEYHWEHEEKWEMICKVWMEMMINAASLCSWKEHAQQLRHGGELLTHVALLMAHLGLTTQIRREEPEPLDFNMPPSP
ncbi:hypothetical protein PTKIN_Ptkin02bG0222400 [Pterospermum kingtungense]